jgi:hypothetical protein
MNQKIDLVQDDNSPREKEFTTGFLTSLILLTISVLLFVVIIENEGEGYHESRAFAPGTPLFTLLPAIFVSGHTISNGLYAFSGKALTPVNLSAQIMTLAGILVVYIIIPTVFFFHWRRRRIELFSRSATNPLRFSSIIYALSFILMLSVSAAAITSAIMGHRLHRSMEHTQVIQSNRDELVCDIVRISLDAYQYRLLPKELGGGQGTYIGFALTPERAKTKNGMYTMLSSENKITINAQSLEFPSGHMNVIIDELGQMGKIQNDGVFN